MQASAKEKVSGDTSRAIAVPTQGFTLGLKKRNGLANCPK
jgi:hypothetical protein